MLARASFATNNVATTGTSPHPDSRLDQVRWRIFLFVVAPAWFFYLALLSPTITQGGDCGELVAASYRLGIAHPSGYAVWSLLGRIFAVLPFGEVAWRYNLFSSVCGAISAGLLSLATFEILQQPRFAKRAQAGSAFWAAISCGFLFAGFYYAASQFLIAEVYSLASLWGALLIWLALRWHFGGDWRDAFGLAFCAGIAPLIHLSTVFILPWLFLLAVWKKRFPPHKIAILCGLFALGLTPIAYFPIRSAQFPVLPQKNIAAYAFYPLDWSHPADLSQLKAHISAAQYRYLLIEQYQTVENGQAVTKKRLAQPISEIPKRLYDFLIFIPIQFMWATPLILIGAVVSFSIRRIGWMLLLVLVGNVATQINYKVPDQTNFFFPAYFVMTIWMGLGWFVVFDFAFRRGKIIAKAAPMLLLTTVLCQWSIFGLTLNAKGETKNRDIGLAQARAAQKIAGASGKPAFIFFGSDDSTWRFWYTKFVLGAAPEVENPWGRRHYKRREQGLWVEDVALRKQTGPVFMANWDARTDQRFPYVPIEKTGLLWLASDNALPQTATPTGQSSEKTGVLSAKIRRDPMWKSAENNDVNVLSGILLALDIELALPENWRSEFRRESSANAGLGGEIELKVGKKGAVQRRRLIIPGNWKGQVLKTTVPLEIDIETKIGRYGLWARLCDKSASPRRTPWQETDFLRVGR